MRILHISDLHASRASEQDSRRLVDGMIADARRLSEAKPVDLVIFSGDLADLGIGDEYDLAEELLVDPLCEQLGLSREQFVFVPGNHDVDRDLISQLIERGLRESLQDRKAVSRLLASPDELGEATKRLRGWDSFLKGFSTEIEGAERIGELAGARTLTIEGRSVGIAMLNSAWRSASKADKGALLLGGGQMEAALDAIAACDIRLVVCHHPLSWLAPFEYDQALREFENRGVIVFSGHEHEPKPNAQKSPRGETVYLQAGCLYAHREYPNSYYLVDIEPDDRQVHVQIRSWYEKRSTFDAATMVAENGAVDFALPRPGTAKDLGHPTPSVVMRRIAALAQERRVVPEEMVPEDYQPNSVDDVLIAPRFLSVPYKEARAAATLKDGISDKEVDPLDCFDEANVVLVSGDAQAGVSSSLLWLLSQIYRHDGDRMPAYMSARESAFGRTKEAATLTKAASLFGYNRTGGPEPSLLLAIDDIERASEKKLKAIAKFIADNPQHRYLLGCETDRWSQVVSSLDDAEVPHERLFLAELGRRELRKLAKTVSPDVDAEIERIYSLLQTQNLPRNPFTMIALIAVLRTAPAAATDLNQTSLLQAFVRLLLGGDELIETERLGMDYRRRMHLLGEIAHELHGTEEKSLPVQEVEAALLKYFSEKALQVSAGQVLQSLIMRGILIERDERISFSHPALFNLFLAEWMLEKSEPSRMEEMLEDCQANAGAIVHAAAIRRNEDRLLERVGAFSGEVIGPMMKTIPLAKVDEILERFTTSGSWEGDQLGDMLDLLPERRSDAELDVEIDKIAEAVESRDKPDNPALNAVNEVERATALLSDVLKSSELVDDAALKREMFELARLGAPEGAKQLRELLERLPRDSLAHNVTMSLTLTEYRTTHDEQRAEGLLDVLLSNTSGDPGGGPLEARKHELQKQAVRKKLVQSRLRLAPDSGTN
jgi:predicted MPP superfamily phosphohydrolase